MKIIKKKPAVRDSSKAVEAYAKKRSAKAATASPLPSAPIKDNWEAKNDLETLTRAEEIRANRGRHAAAMGEGKLRARSLAHVLDGIRIARAPIEKREDETVSKREKQAMGED